MRKNFWAIFGNMRIILMCYVMDSQGEGWKYIIFVPSWTLHMAKNFCQNKYFCDIMNVSWWKGCGLWGRLFILTEEFWFDVRNSSSLTRLSWFKDLEQLIKNFTMLSIIHNLPIFYSDICSKLLAYPLKIHIVLYIHCVGDHKLQTTGLI